MLVRLDHIASRIVNANHCIMYAMVEKQWSKIQKLVAAITEKQRFTGNGVFSIAEIQQVFGGNGRNGSGGAASLFR